MPRPRKKVEVSQRSKRRKAYNKSWHEAHRDEVLARQKAYGLAHRAEKAAYNKDWHTGHRDENRARRLKRNYGLTIKAFNDLLASQGEKCAVCGKKNWGRWGPVIDHDHETGDVRGILCRQCNMAAGLLGDDSERARLLSAYLRGHKKEK